MTAIIENEIYPNMVHTSTTTTFTLSKIASIKLMLFCCFRVPLCSRLVYFFLLEIYPFNLSLKSILFYLLIESFQCRKNVSICISFNIVLSPSFQCLTHCLAHCLAHSHSQQHLSHISIKRRRFSLCTPRAILCLLFTHTARTHIQLTCLFVVADFYVHRICFCLGFLFWLLAVS